MALTSDPYGGIGGGEVRFISYRLVTLHIVKYVNIGYCTIVQLHIVQLWKLLFPDDALPQDLTQG